MKYKMKSKRRSKPLVALFVVLTVLIVAITIVFNLPTIKDFLGLNDGQNSIDAAEAQQAREEAAQQGLLFLVNKQNPVDKNYKPEDLTAMAYYAPDRDAAGRYMREAAATAFSKLVEQAAKDGIELKMTTAYRSYGFQQVLYNNYVNKYGQEAANRFSAKPGQSEHQTGLAVDVSSQSVNYQLTEEFGGTAEGKWLVAHAHEFGFIIRYPKDKEDITGYMYEPWHLRYVGLFPAKEIYEQDMTLEEYLQEYGLEGNIK